MKVKAWILVIMSWAVTFLTPAISAYFLLAKKDFQKTSYGFLYWMVVIVVCVALTLTINKLVMNSKANLFKTTFKFVRNMALLGSLMGILKYMDANIDALVKVLYTAMGGIMVGKLFEYWCIIKYGDYIKEVGVF